MCVVHLEGTKYGFRGAGNFVLLVRQIMGEPDKSWKG